MNIKFGVFTRSVGERTEHLCLESVTKEMTAGRVHLIKDRFPAYRAFEEMFSLALEHSYEWFLGLDSDVVLERGWSQWILNKISMLDEPTVYNFSFPVKDYFIGKADKGNHIFNGRYTKDALHILLNRTKFLGKPESTIKNYLSGLASTFYELEECLGYHGYEQYYKDIFYRFYLQRARNRDFRSKCPFLNKSFSGELPLDYKVARLGWRHGRRRSVAKRLHSIVGHKFPISDGAMRKDFERRLSRLGIIEKEQLPYNLEEFLSFCKHHASMMDV